MGVCCATSLVTGYTLSDWSMGGNGLEVEDLCVGTVVQTCDWPETGQTVPEAIPA